MDIKNVLNYLKWKHEDFELSQQTKNILRKMFENVFKNGRNIEKWWWIRELERKTKKMNLGQTNCIIVQKMNPTVTGKSNKKIKK